MGVSSLTNKWLEYKREERKRPISKEFSGKSSPTPLSPGDHRL